MNQDQLNNIKIGDYIWVAHGEDRGAKRFALPVYKVTKTQIVASPPDTEPCNQHRYRRNNGFACIGLQYSGTARIVGIATKREAQKDLERQAIEQVVYDHLRTVYAIRERELLAREARVDSLVGEVQALLNAWRSNA